MQGIFPGGSIQISDINPVNKAVLVVSFLSDIDTKGRILFTSHEGRDTKYFTVGHRDGRMAEENQICVVLPKQSSSVLGAAV